MNPNIKQEEKIFEESRGSLHSGSRSGMIAHSGQKLFCEPWGLWKAIPENAKTAFLATAVFTLMAHLYAFTNLLLNHDSSSTFYHSGNFLSLARWASEAASNLGTPYTLPLVNGILAVFYLSITAALTVCVLRISMPLNVILVSAFIGTFPVLTSVFAYACEWFLFALLVSALGTFLTEHYRYGWIPGIAFITLGLGVYQSYFAYAIGLLLMDCILRLLAKEDTLAVVKRGVKYILVLAVSVILFYVILQIALRITGTTLRTYKGLDTMGFSQVGNYLAAIPVAYRDYFTFFWDTPYLPDSTMYLQHFLFLLTACAGIYLLVFRKSFHSWGALALILAGTALLPLALSITSAITTGVVNTLNQYSYVLQFAFCLKLIEMAVKGLLEKQDHTGLLTYIVSAVLCCAMLWSNICIDNIAYNRMKVTYDNSLSLGTRVAARVESLEEYTPATPVVFIGRPNYADLYMKASALYSDYSALIGTSNPVIGVYSTRNFFTNIVGISFATINSEQRALLESSDVISTMPSYPEAGSVIYYEGMVLVKFSDGDIY